MNIHLTIHLNIPPTHMTHMLLHMTHIDLLVQNSVLTAESRLQTLIVNSAITAGPAYS
jgi:hypothetical protein